MTKRSPVNQEQLEVIRGVVRILREAGTPLPCHEIAKRLGIKPQRTSRRLDEAVKLKFVEKISDESYRITDFLAAQLKCHAHQGPSNKFDGTRTIDVEKL